MVDADRPRLTGLPFFKMVGSGNDFVFLDGRDPGLRALEHPDAVRRICERRSGVGADGVVWLIPETGDDAAYRMRYYNADGSLADMCGNAALCSIALATRLGLAPDTTPFHFWSDAGLLAGRRRADGQPEVGMTAVRGLAPSAVVPPTGAESRVGAADTGVPHLVVMVADADAVDLPTRGRALRFAPALGAAGANVNFVSPGRDGAWRMRTYERGVEGETLACGTGAVATAALLRAWGVTGDQATIRTSSGLALVVSFAEEAGQLWPSLSGEGRVVFEGRFGTL
jgi:diaminopimelate epimerase